MANLNSRHSRREFLAKLGAGLVGLVGMSLSGCETSRSIPEPITPEPRPQPRFYFIAAAGYTDKNGNGRPDIEELEDIKSIFNPSERIVIAAINIPANKGSKLEFYLRKGNKVIKNVNTIATSNSPTFFTIYRMANNYEDIPKDYRDTAKKVDDLFGVYNATLDVDGDCAGILPIQVVPKEVSSK